GTSCHFNDTSPCPPSHMSRHHSCVRYGSTNQQNRREGCPSGLLCQSCQSYLSAAWPANSGTSKLRCVERLKRIDVGDGLRLLVPLEIAQRYFFGREVSYQEAVFFDRGDGFLHIQVLRWLRADA